MGAGSQGQRSGEREGAAALNKAIKALSIARDTQSVTSAKDVFDAVRVLLTMIKDSMISKPNYVELGLRCANICRELHRRVNGKRLDELNQSVHDAISLLASTVANIQGKLVKWDKRNVISRLFHARSKKKKIAAWKSDLDKILQVFNKELAVNPNVAGSNIRPKVAKTGPTASGIRDDITNTSPTTSDVQSDVTNTSPATSDIRGDGVKTPTIIFSNHHNMSESHKDTGSQERMRYASAPADSLPPPPRNSHGSASEVHREVMNTRSMVFEVQNMLKSQDRTDDRRRSIQASIRGEFPPPEPRIFFGRDELVEKIVDLAENLVPIALTGAGGIGKTSVALAVLHHDRIRQRFGYDRRFIRCDKFPPSCAHFVRRLSKVIGADVENPTNLTPLRESLSSREMVIVLDNAESILDPSGADSEKIYAAVEELGRFSNICVCITSHISTTPTDCKRLDVPTLRMDPARDTFYTIYGNDDRSSLVNGILEQLDFHPLSITLLATVALQSKWSIARLVKEWERQRTRVLHTHHNKSLAAVIELSLASPMFQGLGPDARALLEVTAFLPQGVGEKNLSWMFPTISNVTDIFDKFCILSLAYQNNGFITMLAPLRDYLSPEDPKSSSFLRTTKERYFTQISVGIDPDEHNPGEARWITLEDVNVGRLLDVFTTIDASPEGSWNACPMRHPSRHKRRLTFLRSDGHQPKPECFHQLSRSFHPVGNLVECKRLLTHALKLRRERGYNRLVARISMELSHINHHMGLHKEGIQLEKEALDILKRLGDTVGQAQCLVDLALLLEKDNQLNAAEEAASRAISLIPENGQQLLVCESHGVLGNVYQSKGETKKAIHHFEAVLRIASPPSWHDHLFWGHYSMAALFFREDRLDDAHLHAEQAKLHAVNNAYDLGRAVELQAMVWYKQHRFEEARSEAQRAADGFEKLGAVVDLERCRKLLLDIQGN